MTERKISRMVHECVHGTDEPEPDWHPHIEPPDHEHDHGHSMGFGR